MSTPVHDWILPRLDALIAEAVKNGMDHQVIVAVITDIVEGPHYNRAVAREQDAPQPTGLTDPKQEPITASVLPVTRDSWFDYAIPSSPDSQ
jgi:hypothetical protein